MAVAPKARLLLPADVMTAGSSRPRIVVVGLGPAGPELVTDAARQAIARVAVRFLRTARHPSARVARTERTFDHHYEAGDTFGEVYERIAADLVLAATEHGEVLYAVPGSPLVLERTVALLRADERVDLELVPGLSFLDVAWERLGIDPVEARVRLIDGHTFAESAAGEQGPLLVAHVHDRWVLSDIKLAVDEPPTASVVVLQRLGLPDEAVFEVPWAELDRSFEPDHLTALWIPELAHAPGADVVRLEALMATLRERCPWDREQTHASLRRHLLEEAHEVLEALDALHAVGDDPGPAVDADPVQARDLEALDDAYGHLEEELGDLLFQIVFHARLGAEAGRFTLADVARGVHDKLVARHPHVFGDADIDPATLPDRWELGKLTEKGRASVMDGIPRTLPALAYATKVIGKATTVAPDVLPAELTVRGAALHGDDEARLGDALLALAAAARRAGLDAEAVLRRRADEVASAVRAAEQAARPEN